MENRIADTPEIHICIPADSRAAAKTRIVFSDVCFSRNTELEELKAELLKDYRQAAQEAEQQEAEQQDIRKVKVVRQEEIIQIVDHFISSKFNACLCVQELKRKGICAVSESEVHWLAARFFEKRTGVTIDDDCPYCGTARALVPRKGKYGYFVGCKTFPKCDFSAGEKSSL